MGILMRNGISYTSPIPTLETMDGVLPVANGGTGAMSLSNITVGKATSDASGNNIVNTYVSKTNTSAQTLVGSLGIQKNNTGFWVKSADGSYGCSLQIGSGGVNRGVWDETLNKWMVYADATTVHLNGVAENVTGTVAIGNGGTGATSKTNAIKNLIVIGNNPITSTTNDTVANWKQYGPLSICTYNTKGHLTDQPSQYGLIASLSSDVNSMEFTQLWFTKPSGNMYHRGANANGWYGTWRKVWDSANLTYSLSGTTLTITAS